MLGRGLVVAAATVVAVRGAAGQGADSARTRARFWVRPAASLLFPGAGQLLAHEDRGAAYVAAELYSVLRLVQLTGEGRREGQRFRDLAYEAARRQLTPLRRDTVFEYYETMERFSSSGAYDRGPGPALVPESDPTTYNGSVWELARRTFWPDPNAPPPPGSPLFLNALDFYRTHAVGPGFVWSWRDASLQQDVFRETIRRSDTAYRRAQNQLGFLLANHVVSAIDALISSRLASAARRPAALQTTLGPVSVVRMSLKF